ncbi:MAG TPA: TIGR01777 family oxidoreductase [Syntrophales bacterium]|nr:TIGR01777 family oxidoreductase [Syntrophales bacterium]HPI57505.1 TIGR01777 family oxidoreductase [Syntrophales bacterium]HPN24662.1 TIGR01777 family oxidoreductase [Syntrophales bacterium]HQM29793.1 TIGR01777 family oxidoreductase [Syntrophales bacterium]
MNVFMTGGTGFVGKTLTGELTRRGHTVTILTRKMKPGQALPEEASFLEGIPTARGAWQEKASEHDVFINLAGTSIFSRWTDEVKKELRDSRILITRNLVEALQGRRGKETHFFSTSAVGYYGFHDDDEELTEESPPGTDFLATLAADWEAEARRAEAFGVRVVLCRFGIVLGREGGMLGEIVPLFRFYLGSPLGSGRQWFSWIHERDLAGVFLFLMDHPDVRGPVNCTAPEPVRNREMTETLGRVLRVPTFMPSVPGFVLRLIKGEFGSVILEGQRVLPRKLQAAGFTFRFPQLRGALQDLVG